MSIAASSCGWVDDSGGSQPQQYPRPHGLGRSDEESSSSAPEQFSVTTAAFNRPVDAFCGLDSTYYSTYGTSYYPGVLHLLLRPLRPGTCVVGLQLWRRLRRGACLRRRAPCGVALAQLRQLHLQDHDRQRDSQIMEVCYSG